MSLANRLWGAPRIHGELLKLGIEVAQSTVSKYMARSGRGRSQTWKAFLHNHAAGIGAMDFLIVPTVGFRLLFVLVILRHERRRLISLSITAHPTAEWIAQQITDAFPWDEAPNYMIRDRDASYGQAVTKRLAAMGIRDHPIVPRSPWQNGHAERLIGSIRRECLDHIVVFGEAHLRRILAAYTGYYNELRTHLSLGKDSPGPSAGATAWPTRCSADTRRTSSSILPDIDFGTHNSTSVLFEWNTIPARQIGSYANRSNHTHQRFSAVGLCGARFEDGGRTWTEDPAIHSFNLDHRRRPDTFFTAMATAFFCPTRTTSRLPRVTPV